MMRFTLFLLLAGIATSSYGQSYYVKATAGYSFPLAAYSMGVNSLSVERMETDPTTGHVVPKGFLIKEEGVTGTLNAGPTASATIGYQLADNASVEVDVGYVSGNQYEVVSEERQMLDGEIQYAISDFRSWRASNAFISPSFVLTTGEGLLKPYLKAGPLLALARVTEKSRSLSEQDNNPELTQTEQQYSGNIALGLRGTAGLEMRLNEKMSIFSEVVFLGMQYAPKEMQMLRYEVNGEDQIGLWTIRQRKVTFVDQTTLDTGNPASSPDEPYKSLKTHFGMSSVSAMAGLKIGL